MTLSDFKARIENALFDIAENRQKNALIYANDLIALINMRLINEGVGADGVKFKLYSTSTLEDGEATKNIEKSNRPVTNKGKVARNYKELRELAGLPVDRRTHSFNGDMLKSITATVEKQSKDESVIAINAKDEFNRNKLIWNSNIVKISLLKPNKDEENMVREANNERLKNIMNKIFK